MSEDHKYELVSYDGGNMTVDGTIMAKADNTLIFEPSRLRQLFTSMYIRTLDKTLSIDDGNDFIKAAKSQYFKTGYQFLREVPV